MSLGYIYIRDNDWYKQSKVFKLGITISIKDRENTYITSELYKGNYVKIYELNINKTKLHLIDNLIKKDFKHYNIYYNGGTEFYNRLIIDEIEPYLIKNNIKFISKTNDELYRINRKNIIIDNYSKLVSKLKNKDEINLRDYQILAIDYISNELIKNNKIYLCLATGAGKSLIAFNVINNLKPINILIFSPRIAIKKQNSDNKYLKYLKDYKYNIYNYCYQSYKTIYDLIITNKIENLFIWFDEAHWALDNWIDDKNDIKQFFLNDNNYIKYRLFTTASPNKEFVLNNKKNYGELYEPIRYNELKIKGYLADIKVEIFEKETNIENINYNSLIFNTFNKTNEDRKLGLSFHNSCNSAFRYYLHHLNAFIKGEIDIKPYILINQEFIKNNDDIILKEDLKDIKNIKKELGSNIIYYNDINEFEKEIHNKQKAIGYVVAKYSMGYDNKFIDIIYFTDYKLSEKDIIQSIGRGTRINDNKYLRIILPTNYNNDVGKDYKKIEKVLQYLLLELELEYDNIKAYKIDIIKKPHSINEKIDDERYINEIIEDNNEKSNINTMKHNIIVKANQWTTSKIINQLKLNNIHNIEDYNNYKEKNKNINLPDINELLELKNFNFKDTYINEDECPYYYNKYDCIDIIKTYKKELRKINRDNKKLEYLVSNDKKIPNMSLWYFYGGKRDDYY
jgi:superfamily II DNA or RNA helicase